MSWFRVDDTLWCHRKARKAGLEAVGFWTICGSYASSSACADNGVLAIDDLETLAGLYKVKQWQRLASKLLDAGLWEMVGKDHAFHDWDDYRSGGEAELARRRSKDTDRKRKARESRDASKEMSADVPRTDSVHVLGLSADARPHLPVPSRPDHPVPSERESRAHVRSTEHAKVHPMGDLSVATWAQAGVESAHLATGRKLADLQGVWAQFVGHMSAEHRAITPAEWLRWVTRELRKPKRRTERADLLQGADNDFSAYEQQPEQETA